MTTFSIHDRGSGEDTGISEEAAHDIIKQADLYTGPWGYKGPDIDLVLYEDDGIEDIKTRAVRYDGGWLEVPYAQEGYVNFWLAEHDYDPE